MVLKSKSVFYVSLVLLFVCSYFTFKLFSNLHPEIKYLLSPKSISYKDMEASEKRYPSTGVFVLLIKANSMDEGKAFVQTLAQEIKDSKDPYISNVVYELKDEIDFFNKNKMFFYNLYDFKSLKESLDPNTVVKKEKKLINLFSDFLKYAKYEQHKNTLELPDGYLATRDTKPVFAMLIFPSYSPIIGAKEAAKILNSVNSEIAKTKAKLKIDPQIDNIGFLTEILNEYNSVMNGLIISALITFVLVILALFLFFRKIQIVFPILYSVVIGALITYTLVYFIFGELNYNTGFMCAIIIGNGVNSGVIFAAYYIWARKKGLKLSAAIQKAYTESFKPTLIAALASALAFASLTYSTGSRCFNEFGWIGLGGLIICWACNYSLLPAILSLKSFNLEEKFFSKFTFPLKFIQHICIEAPLRYRKQITIAAGVITLASVLYITFNNYTYLERNFTNIRNRSSVTKRLNVFKPMLKRMGLTEDSFPAFYILANTPAQAELIKDKLNSDKAIKKKLPSISFKTLASSIPKDQDEKIALVKKIKELHKKNKNADLTNGQISLLNEIESKNKIKKITIDDIPEKVKNGFKETDGSTGKLIIASANSFALEKDMYKNLTVIEQTRALAESTVGEQNYNLFGTLPLMTDIAKIMATDTIPIVLISLAFVVLIFIIFYRNIKITSFAVINFIATSVTFIALIPLLGTKINILNFIAIPLTFGIGVDYSSNILQGLITDKKLNTTLIKERMSYLVPAVLLASLTTIIGYCSLLFVSQRAVFSFGVLCLKGELITLTWALLILPSVYIFLFNNKLKN